MLVESSKTMSHTSAGVVVLHYGKVYGTALFRYLSKCLATESQSARLQRKRSASSSQSNDEHVVANVSPFVHLTDNSNFPLFFQNRTSFSSRSRLKVIIPIRDPFQRNFSSFMSHLRSNSVGRSITLSYSPQNERREQDEMMEKLRFSEIKDLNRQFQSSASYRFNAWTWFERVGKVLRIDWSKVSHVSNDVFRVLSADRSIDVMVVLINPLNSSQMNEIANFIGFDKRANVDALAEFEQMYKFEMKRFHLPSVAKLKYPLDVEVAMCNNDVFKHFFPNQARGLNRSVSTRRTTGSQSRSSKSNRRSSTPSHWSPLEETKSKRISQRRNKTRRTSTPSLCETISNMNITSF